MSTAPLLSAENNDGPFQTPLEDLRASALEHYNELATKAHHWSSFVENAIKAYIPEQFASQFQQDNDRLKEEVKASHEAVGTALQTSEYRQSEIFRLTILCDELQSEVETLKARIQKEAVEWLDKEMEECRKAIIKAEWDNNEEEFLKCSTFLAGMMHVKVNCPFLQSKPSTDQSK